MYQVYIIQSEKNGRYYIGVTADLNQRLEDHNQNKNRSTKNKGPWKIVHAESFTEKSAAWLREKKIKKYKGGEAFRKLLK